MTPRPRPRVAGLFAPALLACWAAAGCAGPGGAPQGDPGGQAAGGAVAPDAPRDPVARMSADKRAVHASAELRACARELLAALAAVGQEGRPPRVAIYRVTRRGRADHLGEWLATVLTTHLVREAGGRCEVYTRRKLSRVLEEWKLQATGLVDAATLCRAGKLSGVDAVVVGALDEDDRALRLTCEVIDVTTAGLRASARVVIPLGRVLPDEPALEREAAIVALGRALATPLPDGMALACYDVTRAGARWAGVGEDVARGVKGRLDEGGRLRTYDRDHLATLMEEQALQRTLGDEEAQAAGARLVGAQAIVAGAGATFDRHHEVDLVVIDVETARILSATRALIVRPPPGAR